MELLCYSMTCINSQKNMGGVWKWLWGDSYKVLLQRDITGGNTKPGGSFTENSEGWGISATLFCGSVGGGDLEFIQKENDKPQTILSIRTPQRGANVDRDGYFWEAFFIMHQKARAGAFWCFFWTWHQNSLTPNSPKSEGGHRQQLYQNISA